MNSDIRIGIGTIGWGDDPNFVDIGTASNDGNTLVSVTLFGPGRNPTKATKTGSAQGGIQIRCRLMGPLYYIPPLGTVVAVACPDDMWSIAGSAFVLGTLGPTPTTGFDKTTAQLSIPGASTLNIVEATVNVGDNAAVFLAVASKVLTAITDLQGAFSAWTPVANDGGAALKATLNVTGPPLGGWINKAYNFATTKAKGT